MIIYNLPDSIKPSEVSYRLVTTQSVNRSPFTGHETIYQYSNKYWELLVTFPQMLEYQAKEFDSIFSAINNKKDLLRYNISTLDDGFTSRGVNDYTQSYIDSYDILKVTLDDGTTEVLLYPVSNSASDNPNSSYVSWHYRSDAYTHATHGSGYWYLYQDDGTTADDWYIDFGTSATLGSLSTLDGGRVRKTAHPSQNPPLGEYFVGSGRSYTLTNESASLNAMHTGRIISSNGNLYKVTNVTGGGEVYNFKGERGVAHLFPPKKGTWTDANVESENPFGYFTIADDFEWDYNQALRTQITIPLKEYIQPDTTVYSVEDNLHELSGSSFGGYYYYGDDGTNGEGYYYPLFLVEQQANDYTTHDGETGDGTSHTHEFATAPNIVFYMPDGLSADQYAHGASSFGTESREIIHTDHDVAYPDSSYRYVEPFGVMSVGTMTRFVQIPDNATQLIIQGSNDEVTWTDLTTVNEATLNSSKHKINVLNPRQSYFQESYYYYYTISVMASPYSSYTNLRYKITESRNLTNYHTRHYLSTDTVEYDQINTVDQTGYYEPDAINDKVKMGARDLFSSVQGGNQPSGYNGY